MRNNTVLTTLLLAFAGGLLALYLFFPKEASLVTGSVRRMIDPNRPDHVKLEYMAVNPELSRGWRTLRTVARADQCYPLLTQDHSRDRDVAGPIGALRCVAYHANGEPVGTLRIHRLGQATN
ncbi:hypothetical protein ACJ4V0_10810 [Phreatobacter sp. HK31-P]